MIIRDVCRITHHNDEAYLGALAVLLSLRLPTNVEPPAFQIIADELPDSRVRDRLLAFANVQSDTPIRALAEQFGSSGYVVDTVPLAMFIACRLTAAEFEAALDELVQSGGDTDTIGSIAGQIAGARLGLANLPGSLVKLSAVQEVFPAAEILRKKSGRYCSSQS